MSSNAFPEIASDNDHPIHLQPGLTKLEYAAIHIAAHIKTKTNEGLQLSEGQIARDAVKRATTLLQLCEDIQA